MSGQPVTVHHADALEALRAMPDNSVDSIVTDPPYGLAEHKPATIAAALTAWTNGDREHVPDGRGFMGRRWDAFVPPPAVWDEALRVLKPGGHLLAFAGSRTADLMGISIRLAGFEMRDTITWHYASGFPKSLDVSKAIDKAAGVEREVVGSKIGLPGYHLNAHDSGTGAFTAPATEAAQQWQGWGTALKPASEPIVVARKPLGGTVAACVLEHGTGALNIDATRVTTSGGSAGSSRAGSTSCTCPSPGDARTSHSPSTPPPASPGDAPAGRNDLPASARAGETGRPPLRGSLDGYPTSPRSDGAHAPSSAAGDPASGPQRLGALGSPAPRATSGRIPDDQSTTCPQCTAGHVESGRWPANVVLTHAPDCGPDDTTPCVDGCPVAELDAQSGDRPGMGARVLRRGVESGRGVGGPQTFEGGAGTVAGGQAGYDDAGGASRFFPTFRYQAKAPTRERPSYVTDDGRKIAHPTVKPLALIRWLVRLVTPPGGLVVDPFAGSGTTGEAAVLEGFRAVLVELDAEHLPLIAERLTRVLSAVEPVRPSAADVIAAELDAALPSSFDPSDDDPFGLDDGAVFALPTTTGTEASA